MAADIHRYTRADVLLEAELSQRESSGFDVAVTRAEVEAAGGAENIPADRAMGLFRSLGQASVRPDWGYIEPSDLAGIEAASPGFADRDPGSVLTERDVADRLAGGWWGRCAGNCLGKPVERGDTWTRPALREFLASTGNFPIRHFVDADGVLPAGMRLVGRTDETCQGSITRVPRDDDLDYTILAVRLLTEHGVQLTTQDVAGGWVRHLPYLAACTAERVAYRNLITGVPIDLAATVDNPYREWIGALIRADVFGWVSAGRPAQAARLAWQDARLSHTANGIYGSMWVAALLALILTPMPIAEAYERSMAFVPQQSRLAEILEWVHGLHPQGWEVTVEAIEARLGSLHWVHVLNNAAMIAGAVLTSGDDFTGAIGRVVAAGLDTDSNGATVGSIVGTHLGRTAIEDHWTSSFHDRISTGLGGGIAPSSVTELIKDTQALAHRIGFAPVAAGRT